MKVSIIHKTTSYRGDHDAEVSIAIEPKENETVEELADRLLGVTRMKGEKATQFSYSDYIEIRIVKED